MLVGDFLLIELRRDILRRLQRFLHLLGKFIRPHASHPMFSHAAATRLNYRRRTLTAISVIAYPWP